MSDHRRQWVALILSGILPGLGQLYLRAWVKGVAFLTAGIAAFWALDQLVAVDDLLSGVLPHPGLTLALLLALLGLSLWSLADAWTTGRQPSK